MKKREKREGEKGRERGDSHQNPLRLLNTCVFPRKWRKLFLFFFIFFTCLKRYPHDGDLLSPQANSQSLFLFSLFYLSETPKNQKPLRKTGRPTFFFGLNPFLSLGLAIYWVTFSPAEPVLRVVFLTGGLIHSKTRFDIACNPPPDLTTWRCVYSHMILGPSQWDVYMSKHSLCMY